MFRKLIVIVSLLVTGLTTVAVSPFTPALDGNCPSAPARLNQGDIAVVSADGGPSGLNLRVQPGLNEQIIMSIPNYSYVTVIAGPKCKGGYRWYEIGFNGQDGWSAEVGPDGIYNLVPNGQPMPTQPSQGTQGGSIQQQDGRYPDSLLGTWENDDSWCINPQAGYKCSVKAVITRGPDGKESIVLTIDSQVINLSSEQGTYQQFCGIDSCSWAYVFNLDGTEAQVNTTDDGKLSLSYYGSSLGVGTFLSAVTTGPTVEPQPTQQGFNPCPETAIGEWAWIGSLTGATDAYALSPVTFIQCVNYVRTHRSDVKDIYGDGGQWADVARGQGFDVVTGDLSQWKTGDIVVWTPSATSKCEGIPYPGHVAILIYAEQNGNMITLHVNEANHCPGGVCDGLIYHDQRYTVSVGAPCMSLIHMKPGATVNLDGYAPPTAVAPPLQPPVNCNQYPWWSPRKYWCLIFGK